MLDSTEPPIFVAAATIMITLFPSSTTFMIPFIAIPPGH